MKSFRDLDRLLDTMDVAVEQLVVREVDAELWSEPAQPGSLSIHFVVAGVALVAVGERACLPCEAGTMLLVPPNMHVRITPSGSEAPGLIAHATVVARLSEAMGLLDRAKVPILENLADSPVAAAARDGLLCEKQRGEGRLGSKALVNTLMKALILTVLHRFFDRPGVDQKTIGALADPALAGPVADVLDDSAAPHSVNSLAARAGLTCSTFTRRFQLAMGMGPMEFVARARLHRAAELLRSGMLPVKTIAARVGFASRSHFSKAFRDLYGRDPTAFRQTEGPTEVTAMPACHHPVDTGTSAGSIVFANRVV